MTPPSDKAIRILTLETTCDETAAAVVTDGPQVLSSIVASQDELHRPFGGVVPEIAARAHVTNILPVIDEALRRAGVSLPDLDAVAVANTPGLAGSLLVGLAAAKALCLTADLPLVAVNHLEAHLYACRMAAGRDVFPAVGLVVSGGHTSLYLCHDPLKWELLGGTIDDAAGEAFDKVASLLGLGFPGGPAIQRAAAEGRSDAYHFPRTFLHERDRLDFSFSGLKTAVRYQVFGTGSLPDGVPLDKQQLAHVAASFQEAVVDVLVAKSIAALDRTGLTRLCVGGGVAANKRLREKLEQTLNKRGAELFVPPLSLCTDNAAMGAIAIERFRAGLIEDLDLDVFPGLIRPGRPMRAMVR